MNLKIVILLVAVCLIPIVLATLSSSDRKEKKKSAKEEEPAAKPEPEKPEKEVKDEGPKVLTQTLDELGLMKMDVDRNTLIKYYQNYASENKTKNFKKPTLGFVTPWNNYGYDFAKEFAVKLDMVSPVWLQIRGDQKNQACFFTGTHDVDKGWMAELKARNPSMKIVPRVMFEAWAPENTEKLFKSETYMHNCISAIKTTCQIYGFDGVVMEMWLQAGLEYKEEMIHFMADLKIAMNDEGRLAILVLPPAIRQLSATPQIVSRKDFSQIAPVVDYATLMTYDYFHPVAKPSPTAPIQWVRANIEILTADGDPNREKLLTGINFYGYEFLPNEEPKAVLARDYVKLLKKYKPEIKWDSFGHENYIEFGGKSRADIHTAYYPTLRSMSEKLDVARQMGTGLMIWELGQGPRIFGELL